MIKPETVQDFARLAVVGMYPDIQVMRGKSPYIWATAERIVSYWEGKTGLLDGSDLVRWMSLAPSSEDWKALREAVLGLVRAGLEDLISCGKRRY